jgi:hypothetical protein
MAQIMTMTPGHEHLTGPAVDHGLSTIDFSGLYIELIIKTLQRIKRAFSPKTGRQFINNHPL